MTVRRRIAVLVVIGALAGCSGSSGGSAAPASPSPTVDTVAADKASITTAWEAFFHAGGTVEDHIALLEDGAKFRTEITASNRDPANAFLNSKVTDVALSGPTAATVTYDLLGKDGLVLLGGTIGEAVKVGDTWLVSKKTYCQLIKLQDPSVAHPGCTE